jgi:hypothetical protein
MSKELERVLEKLNRKTQEIESKKAVKVEELEEEMEEPEEYVDDEEPEEEIPVKKLPVLQEKTSKPEPQKMNLSDEQQAAMQQDLQIEFLNNNGRFRIELLAQLHILNETQKHINDNLEKLCKLLGT